MLLRCCKRGTTTSETKGGKERRRVDVSSDCYLVLSHAPFLDEVGAGGALLFTVAVVKH